MEKKPPALQWEKVTSFAALAAQREQQSSPASQAETTPIRQHGLDVFYDNSDAATVTTLSEAQPSYGYHLDGLNDVKFSGSAGEHALVEDMLDHPCLDPQVIRSRQEVIRLLISNVNLLQRLCRHLEKAYTLSRALHALLDSDKQEQEHALLHGKRPKKRIEQLLECGVNPESVRTFLHEDVSTDDDRPKDIPGLQSLHAAGQGKQMMLDFTQSLRDQTHPVLQEIGTHLLESIQDLPSITPESILQDALADPSLQGLHTLEKRVSGITGDIVKAGAILSAAVHVMNEGFGRATFDSAQPRDYHGGWNALKEKKAYSYRREGDHYIRQVPNDAPADRPVTILCGGNMSGKSFALRRELSMHRWAQSFGYVSARSGNFPVLYDSLVYLDRASTDAPHDLSAFGKEVNQLQAGIAACRGRPYVLSDEFASTTSPEDQYRLCVGLLTYLQNRGARLMMANHNEQFLARCARMADCGIHHFRTGTKPNGDIDFLYKIEEGIDESHAIEVARRMGMPSEVTDAADAYLRREHLPANTPPLHLPPITAYSPEEREALKSQSGSLRMFLPYADEMVITQQQKWHGESYRRLDWCFTEDDRCNHARKVRDTDEAREWKALRDHPFFLQLSNDPELRYHVDHTLMPGQPQAFQKCTKALLFEGATGDTKELLERQKMYDALMEGDRNQDLTNAVQNVWALLWAAERCDAQCLIAFNEHLFKGCAEHFLGDRVDLGFKALDGQLLLEVIALNADLLSLDLTAIGVERDMADLTRICALQAECENSLEERISAMIDPRTDQAEVLDRCFRPVREAYAVARIPCKEEHPYHSCKEPMLAVVDRIVTKLSPHIRPLALRSCDTGRVRTHIARMYDTFQKVTKDDIFIIRRDGILIQVLEHLLRDGSAVDELVQCLRSYDSVHLHRLSHYLESIFDTFLNGKRSGAELRIMFEQIAAEQSADQHHYSKMQDAWCQNANNRTLDWIRDEITTLSAILAFARTMKEEGYCRVAFNDTGELAIEGGWSVTKPKEEQVRNDCTFAGEQRVQLATGANMSGKTFDIKKVSLALLSAQATGHAPAASMTTPVHESVVYLDRVQANEDENLSAFGNEVMHWRRLSERTQQGHTFFGVDEAFSTTSPKYQGALSYGVCSHLLGKGHRLYMASHHHQFIDAFTAAHPECASAHHFHTQLNADGTLSFDYLKQTGHQPSQAIAVARTLGMDPAILAIAEMIPLEEATAEDNHPISK
ncbi:MAG: hypothetical protein PHH13_00055 [Candidatus Peribacteraceae bacterium]|nr:hypothetical protein [Candidatus Peribacteraceae bacterium]